jgi:hypothetical protein
MKLLEGRPSGKVGAPNTPGRSTRDSITDDTGETSCDTFLLPLTRGLYTLIDREDLETVAQYRWHATPQVRSAHSHLVYARRSFDGGTQTMHVLLAQPGLDEIVHHLDGNGLNNRRSNLAVVSAEEHRILHALDQASSGERYIHRDGSLWRVRLGTRFQCMHGGRFATLDEAITARDALVARLGAA